MPVPTSPQPAPLDTVLVRSRFLEVFRLRTGNAICLHTLEQSRLVVRPEVVGILDSFATPQRVGDWLAGYATAQGLPRDAALAALGQLAERHFLFRGSREEEEAKYAALAELFAGDPAAAQAFWEERGRRQGLDRYFSVNVPRDVASFTAQPHRLRVILFGFCDVQIGIDLLREEARQQGIELEAAATFETDTAILAERPHDAVIVGALAARHGHWYRSDGLGDFAPERYLASARALLERVRAATPAPILIHNLPVPTSSPLGMAERAARGADGLLQRCRRINLGLEELAAEVADCHLIDVDGLVSLHGKRRLIDDRLATFSHLGGLGWWTLPLEHELHTVHGVRPPVEQLRAWGVVEPFEYDRLLAREEVEALTAVFGFGRRKCVLVDLDNTLWPGVLADTQSPFPPSVDFTLFSYHTLYLGLHQALKALAARGILLAVVSKNDEPVVRQLWRYPERAPRELLLEPADFVTMRINWREKVDNILDISRELGVAPDAMVLVDDSAVEREKVRRFLPAVWTLGEDLLLVRSVLLTSPALQVPRLTDESQRRTAMTQAQLRREEERQSAVDQSGFLASLGLECAVERVGPSSPDLDRIHELVLRTNQFNTTTRRYGKAELVALLASPTARVYSMRVRDRFTDYGLVGVVVVEGGTIELFLMSCRVIGLGVEDALLRTVLADLAAEQPVIEGRFIPSERNQPARNLFAGNGFSSTAEGLWRLELGGGGAGSPPGLPAPPAPPAPPAHCRVSFETSAAGARG